MRQRTRSIQPADELIAETAWLYYIRGHTQGEISTKMSISRPTVISYLRLARERGIVRIHLDAKHTAQHELAHDLMAAFSLDHVQIVPGGEDPSAEASLQSVCEVAGHALVDFVDPDDELGVSWGETISILAETMPYWPVPGLKVRQLIGSMANPLVMSSERCTTEIAHRLGGQCINMNAPAVCSSAELAQAMRAEPIIREQLSSLRQCNKAVFSLSPCTGGTHLVVFKVATAREVADYRKRGAVCIIAGRFLDCDGNRIEGALDERLFSVELDVLQSMNGMLVASGKSKCEPTLSALRGGYVNRMVLSAELARQVLKKR